MTDELWTVWTAHKRRRFVHNAHSPGDDGVGHFSIIKWVLFQLSRFRRNNSRGSFFDCQMGTSSADKNILLPQSVSPTRVSQNDAVGSFSTVKWRHFRLSKFTLMGQSGFIFT